jgi:hypothetical protein
MNGDGPDARAESCRDGFCRIGYETEVGGQRYAGPVLATAEAIYCILGAADGPIVLLATALHGGAIGALVVAGMITAAAAGRSILPTTAAAVVTIDEVPEQVRSRSPLRRFGPRTRLLMLPRESVTPLVKESWINNVLAFHSSGQVITITHRMLAPGKVRRYLTENGWPIIWRGERVNC